jgi:hypothetical protein
MKLVITESHLKYIIERSFAYHVGNVGKTTDEFEPNKVKPYYSENIVMIDGTRGTGHFGSGMYFSTYNCKGWEEKDYQEKFGNKDVDVSKLHKVDKGVYRVDMDLYKNLYKVRNFKQGKFLHDVLKSFNSWHSMYSEDYYALKNNLEYLGLKIPPFKELVLMNKKAKADKQQANSSDTKNIDYRSMSTRIMEYNGYNGVNVSGISELDNTSYGSVIYDLSKWDEDTERIPDNKVNNYCQINKSGKIDYITDNSAYNKPMVKRVLDNLYTGREFLSKTNDKDCAYCFESIPPKLLPHFFKMYQHFIPDYYFDNLSPEIQNAYLNGLPRKFINGTMRHNKIGNDLSPIIKNRINYIFNQNYKIGGVKNRWETIEGKPIFNVILDNSFYFDDNIIKMITDKIENGSVKLSPKQQEAYNDYKKEWDEYK